MNASDWLGGFALASFLAIPCGMVVSLLALVTDKPGKYIPDAPLISRLDIRRCLITSAAFILIFTFPMAELAKKDRQDAESWQVYVRDHKCVAVDQRTQTHFQFNPATKTTQTSTTTEYLWRCDNGEQWHP